MYQVKTKQFEGPLNLLLELIEGQKMDITQLSITQVADDFLQHIEDPEKIDLAVLSDFLGVASQLILLKSKALLPLFEFTKEEEEEIEGLEERLKEYQKFKDVSGKINEIYSSWEVCYAKEEEKLVVGKFVSPDISKEELLESYISVLQEVPTKQELDRQVVEEIVSLEEKIGQLRTAIEARMKVAFHETIAQASSKVDVIVTFLAMLEMVKQKVVTVQQSSLFEEILIEKSKKV